MIKKQLAMLKRTVGKMLRIDNKHSIPWTMIVCLWPRDRRMRKNWEDSKRHLQEWGVKSGSQGRRLHTEEMAGKQTLKHQPHGDLGGGKGLCWLVLCQLKSSYGYLGRENPSGKNLLIRLTCRQACSAFSWLMIDVRWPRSPVVLGV